MQYIFLLLSLLLVSCSHTPYVSSSVGYVLHEQRVDLDGNGDNSEIGKISCTFELGLETDNISYGIRHNSRCFVNYPFNDKKEYFRDELFIRYKHKF